MAGNKATVGNVELISVKDGSGDRDPMEVYLASTIEEWREYPELLDSGGRIHPRYGSVVARSGGKLVLVDTGLAAPDGTLLDELSAAGVDRGAIDLVVMTHLHGDHVGWNLSDGRPTFPNARYLVPRADYEYWTQPSVLEGAPHIKTQVMALGELRIIDLIDSEYNLTDDLTTMATPGHTPGHISILISSAGQRGIILGDVAHTPAQAHYTNWSPVFDVDPDVARKAAAYGRASSPACTLLKPSPVPKQCPPE